MSLTNRNLDFEIIIIVGILGLTVLGINQLQQQISSYAARDPISMQYQNSLTKDLEYDDITILGYVRVCVELPS